ncbi:MAG: hypothetical protein EOM72_07075 [Opitutae bacterium]|nr:hypothetical protein [Opitutae bacterium]
MKIVLCGEIGSGKSTVARAALRQLGWDPPAGFSTHWGGAGRGADVLYFEPWAGEPQPMARRIAGPAASGGLPYELDRAKFAKVSVASLAAAAEGRPVAIDELGLIELGSAEFIAALAEVFRGPAPVLAVIQQRALDRWLAILGRERVDHLLAVAPATRAALPAKIAALFGLNPGAVRRFSTP